MIQFYNVAPTYIKFLQQYDSRVPNILYEDSNHCKFVCGVILNINTIDYYAPISHFNKKQRTNFPIYSNENIIASVRVSYMFPASNDVLELIDFKQVATYDSKYASLMRKEYKFLLSNKDKLIKKAEQVYKIGCNKQHVFNHCCCDFKLLEHVYFKYNTGISRQQIAAASEELIHHGD